ncbi:hypothetical protein BI347_22220 [Chromobacterium sphagni]|uniref:Terminase small subunit n=1 Tax=Chromobacterium sphagni TaxID=1903179 RepID=A0A1S1WTR5_9NEIS|nr:hypothetical protein [Chromobacterium sphagni]OHX10495.1 hypothetical protein BI347_22220 [Chromobacterium sphagni]
MSDEITKSAFAELLGVSRGYISQLCTANRLVLSGDGKKVQVQTSLELLASTGSAEKMGLSARHALERWKKGGAGLTVQEAAQALQPGPDSTPPAPTVPGGFEGVDLRNPIAAYNAARAANEFKRGEQIDIDLAKSRRELISQEVSVKLIADLAATTRASFERIPDRIATKLAAESDPHVVYALLEEAIDECCVMLSKQAAKLAGKL